MSKKSEGMQENRWKCLVIGDHYPHEFDRGGWMSGPNEEYPADILLGLKKVSNIYKIVFEVDDRFPPSKIEISVGLGDDSIQTDYKNARLAEYCQPIDIEFGEVRGTTGRTETKSGLINLLCLATHFLAMGTVNGISNLGKIREDMVFLSSALEKS
uniref:Gamma-glutamylcyclotransferase n=1 Tax=Angiostrongylus cantonensis TaxID=6313 RepID=A0A0K0CZP3_ANGCA